MMLRNTLGDDEKKVERIDPTLMFNFYAMKQGEKEKDVTLESVIDERRVKYPA